MSSLQKKKHFVLTFFSFLNLTLLIINSYKQYIFICEKIIIILQVNSLFDVFKVFFLLVLFFSFYMTTPLWFFLCNSISCFEMDKKMKFFFLLLKDVEV
jgi:hypothetical protein